ncbi:ABC transporter substrate-binding protein [Halarcobacter ebronensis]|uniref:histidine kinase n=1 Tax=Halarcobacter ebronensis TaxID=1462615 RepID=A0A4V1M0K5_9BACT|nr:ABC transporter substrate-binding protein [Halarcobacter ebronensis]QKF81055.1 BvgS-like domain-containing signal transduction sensor histidine kinase (NMT1, PAS domains) [Halarcobacter ebronensis]RXK06363.1 hypothetical protein CRV07_06625 [Halarcobacter ebronensis]
MIKKLLLFFLCVQSLISSETNLEKISVQLNWKYQFEYAGFIAAKEEGFYKEVGLDVEIKEFKDGIDIVKDLMSGQSTFSIYDFSLLNLEKGKDSLKLIANYFKRSALVLVTKQDIVTPFDLKGKRIMAEKNEMEVSTLNTLFKKFNIKNNEYNFIQHSYSAKEFIEGNIDAMSAYLSNELYYIRKSNIPYNIIDPQTYGIYGSGVNVFTTLETTKQRPDLVKKFVEATNRGWEYALKHKDEIVDVIYNKYSKRKEKAALSFEAKQIDKLIMPTIYKIGEVNKQLLKRNLNELISDGLIKNNDVNIDDIVFDFGQNKDSVLSLSSKQKEYIANKRVINMCIDPNWMPYEKIQNGKHIGMTSEFMSIISEKIGIPIKLIPTKTWKESMEFAKQRKCDIFSLALATPSRLKYMNFTTPYVSFPLVIATNTNELFISEPSKIIKKENVGIVEGYAINELLRSAYPENKIVDVENIEEGLKKVAKGELFGFVGALPTVAYNLQHRYIGELKISGKFDYNSDLSIGVRNDDSTLFEILQKAVASIDEKTKQEIINNYISIKVESGFDYELFYQMGLLLLIIGIFLFYRHLQVTKHNKVLKKQQKKLNKSNTELIETKKKLENSIKDFEVMINSVHEAIFIFEDDICIDSNEVAHKMFGYDSKKDIIGKHIRTFVPIETYKVIAKNRTSNYYKSYEAKGIKRDGTIIDVIAKGTNAIINSKSVRISVVVDISETKQKEQLLFQQSKMAAMGQMLENIAHQWRQPLSLISSLATGIELKRDLGISTLEDELKDLSRINETSQHLSETIEDFRNFFKTDKKKIDFSILKAVEKNISLIEGMLKTNSIELVFLNKEDITINSYENEFTQALINIFYNAKDALEKVEDEKYIFIDIKKSERNITVSIKDNAGGIDEKILKSIFEPYFTTKHKKQGTGIGLYMTQMIIEKHMEGSIEARTTYFNYNDKSYKGAEFIMRLPLQ